MCLISSRNDIIFTESMTQSNEKLETVKYIYGYLAGVSLNDALVIDTTAFIGKNSVISLA